MGYRLGVDLGTTFTAAAIGNGQAPSMLGLGNRALQIPSVLFLQEDGSFLVGEPAERRGLVEPQRLVREFKRRIGDHVPLLVAGTPYSPQALTARLLSWVVATATERVGGPPDALVLTHPANWGAYKRDLLDQVLTLADVENAYTCPEPQAAAVQYASRAELQPGVRVVVYDLGGGTFDVCVLERTGTGFTILGNPEGIEHLGGIDFDEAVFRHVLGTLQAQLSNADLDSAGLRDTLARLRRDCVEAKEALSSDVDAVIPVTLPGANTSVRFTRAELESLIGPSLQDTISATDRALRTANTTPEQLSAIVLVGGSSRIPLVSHLLQEHFGTPTALDTHPKHDIALGAVRYHPSGPATAGPVPSAPTAEGPVQTAPTPTPPGPRAETAATAQSRLSPQEQARRSGQAVPLPPTAAPSGTGPAAPLSPSSRPATSPTAAGPPAGAAPLPAAPGAAAPATAAVGTAPPTPPPGVTPRPLTTGPPPPPKPPRRSPAEWFSDQSPGARIASIAGVVVALVAIVAVVWVSLSSPSDNPAGSSQTTGPPQSSTPPTGGNTGAPHAPGLPTSADPLPDGEMVAGVAGPGGGLAHLFLADAAGTSDPILVQGVDTQAVQTLPALSPDRQTIVYLQSPGPGDPPDTLLAVGASADGGRAEEIDLSAIGQGCVHRPAWSPDARELAVRCSSGHEKLGLYDLAEKTFTRLPSKGLTKIQDLAFNPKSSDWVYFAAESATQSGLWRVATDGGSQPELLSSQSDADLAWSPSGDLLAFRRLLPGGQAADIMVMSPSGAQVPCARSTITEGGRTVCRVTHTGTQAQDPSWSPDGTQIAFKDGNDEAAVIKVVDARGRGKPTDLLPSGWGDATGPAWSTR